MKLKKITESDIEDIADSMNILNNGKDYYRRGRVLALQIKGDSILAVVLGSSRYKVKIPLTDDISSDAECSCPYGGPGCKHIVAVLYNWLNIQADYKDYQIKSNSLKENRKRIDPFKYLKFEDFIRSDENEKILKAFELINKKAVKITSGRDLNIEADVNDGEIYNVSISAERNLFRNTYIFWKECSCGKSYYRNNCEHVLALIFLLIKKLSPEQISEDYEIQIRKKLNAEKYKNLVNSLDSISIQKENYNKKFKLSFSITKSEDNKDILLSIQKSPILKNGLLGQRTAATLRFIRNNYATYSDEEKRILNIMFSNLNEGVFYGYSPSEKAVKSSFKSPMDLELLRCLRNLYDKQPEYFIDCNIPNKKALIEIAIREQTINAKEKKHSLKIVAKIDDKSYSTNNKLIIQVGESSLWLYKSPLKTENDNRGVLIEIETAHPSLLKNISKFSDLEISQSQLHNFIEKYYLKLSELGNIQLPDEQSVEEIDNILPKPRLFLKNYGNSFYIELKFLYGDKDVLYNTNYDILKKSGDRFIKVRRKREDEERFVSILQGYSIQKDNLFFPIGEPLTWLCDISSNLIAQGFEIYGQDSLINYKILKDEPQLQLKVSSGIDWFDIKADVDFNGKKVGFDTITKALCNHERFIKLSDGSIGIIPKKWLSKLSGVIGFLEKDKKQDSFKAVPQQIEIIEALIDISKKADVDKKYKEIKNKFKEFKEIKEVSLPKTLIGELRPYQKSGYDWLHFLKEFSFGGCLADEMGLGKTLQILALLLYEKEQGNSSTSLVVVPTSLIFNWIQEINKFVPSLKIYIHHGQDRIRNIKKISEIENDIVLTTYGTLRNDIELFKEKQFYYIVLDESQQIKNPLAKNTRSVYNLKGEHRLVLTGTPIENNYLELWSQFSFLNPGLLGSIEYFKNTFMKNLEKNKKEERVNALKGIINPFLLMRKKNAVAQDLPEKQITTLYCEMEEEQRIIYEHWKEKFRTEIKESIERDGFMKSKLKIIQGLTRLRQICNHPSLVDESFKGESAKFNLLIRQIEEVVESNHKVLIFSSFVKMLSLFRKYFLDKGIIFSYLDGQTKNRKEVVTQFQEDKNIKAFLISIKAGGLGLNLTAADYVFIVDPWWNPAVEMQAIDRTHRIGQVNKVFVYKAITKDSVEEKILELQESKKEIVEKVITAEEGMLKQLNQEDIQKLFK